MFSGIGGFELGIQRAFDNRPDLRNRIEGIPEDNTDFTQSQVRAECIGYSEIDKYAIKVYERNFNGRRNQSGGEQSIEERQQTQEHELHTESIISTTHNTGGHTNYGDATKINPTELPDFDLLVGGFPCQAFSIAGKRAGFNDIRGTLFFDIARILKEKQPRHLVLENVKGLLSHDGGRTFTTIIGVLTDLGYSVEWQVLNSKNFGVPQNRERVYIVGHLGNECGRKVFPITASSGTNIQYDVRGSQRFRVYNKAGLAPTIPTMQGGNTEPKILEPPRIRRLTPLECERLQGFPDNWTVGESDTQRYKMCGNAVTVNTVQAVMEKLFNEICK